MLPLYDENPTKHFPLVTLSFLGANIYIFVMEVSAPQGAAAFIAQYAMIPALVLREPLAQYPSIFSSMFMHAGWGHLAGNMLYLWIFGNNIEDVLRKFRFILFYFTCGAIAALCHVLSDLGSTIPMVGASGAVSGILGAYLVLFPRARVKTLIFLGFFITVVSLPAVVLLGVWILIQVASGLLSEGPAGVAWMAHIGGFFAGMILILPFKALGRS
ncbi:MAG: rhomboid family intramembrane serine protease [Nitrospinaceae bacterium]